MNTSANDDATPAEAESQDATVAAPDVPGKMDLNVEIEDVGPCRKHVCVTVPRSDVEAYYEAAIDELRSTAEVPGFRVGRVPKKLIGRRFRKQISDEVKQKVLIESLEQLSEEYELDPIDEPELDLESIEIPEEGDFEYEFEVEVRPDFELPKYEGLKIERPVREVGDTEVDEYLAQFLDQYGQLVPHEGPAEPGDVVVASVEILHGGETLRKMPEINLQLRPVLRFRDAELEGFDELMAGVTPGETREAELTVSEGAEVTEMRGETVQARITVNDVKRSRPPELNKEFLERIGVESEDDLREQVASTLDRQMVYRQRQETRRQVLEKITESADWELPEAMVRKQVENAMHREILEMQQAGFTTAEIRARENELRQNSVSTTRQAMKEHFVLDKIANEEGLDVAPAEIEMEIQLMAMQRGENPRRLRARLTKSGVIENLEAQIRERKAVDVILERAEFEDVEMEPFVENRVAAIDQSVCGAITEGPSAAAAPEDQPASEPDE